MRSVDPVPDWMAIALLLIISGWAVVLFTILVLRLKEMCDAKR